MKRHALTILTLLLLALPAAAQVTTVTGVARDYALEVLPDHPYTIKEVRRGGYIIPIRDVTGYTDSVGVLTFQVPRSDFTTFDTTKVHFVLDAPQYWNNGRGVWLIIPDAATADLTTLPPAQYLGPPGFAVVIPPQGGGYGDSIRMADSLARYALELAQNGQYGDSIRIADSLARVALDSAAAARQDLLNSIAVLQAQLDTAGNASRSVIEAEVADLYSQLSALSGQIVALSARVDTLGRAERGVIESEVETLFSENDAQDLLIADAGKWVQYDASPGTYKVAAPKWTPVPGDTLVAKIDNAGNARYSGTVTSMSGMYADVLRPTSGTSFFQPGTQWVVSGTPAIKATNFFMETSNVERFYLTSTGKFAFGGASVPRQYLANFGGSVWVHPDSALYAVTMQHPENAGTNNAFLSIRPRSAATSWKARITLAAEETGLTNGSVWFNTSKGLNRPYWYINDYDWDYRTTAGVIMRLRETGGGGGDSAVQVGESAATRGLHVYGGIKAEGNVTSNSVTTTNTYSYLGLNNVQSFLQLGYSSYLRLGVTGLGAYGELHCQNYKLKLGSYNSGIEFLAQTTTAAALLDGRFRIKSGITFNDLLVSFEIPGHMKMPKDSSFKAGHVEMNTYSVDSTGRVVNIDSLTAWKRTFIKDAEAIYNGWAGYDGEEGYVDIEMTLGHNLDGGVQAPFFEVVSDSAAGYFIAGIEYKISFQDGHWARSGVQEGYISNGVVSTTDYLWTQSAGTTNRGAGSIITAFSGRDNTQGHTKYRAPLFLRGSNRTGFMRMYLRVKFVSKDRTSSSSWYIKLENT